MLSCDVLIEIRRTVISIQKVMRLRTTLEVKFMMISLWRSSVVSTMSLNLQLGLFTEIKRAP